MCKSYQSAGLLVDEIELQVLRNKIADIIQDEFVREMNGLVHEEARRCCEGCRIDDLSQLHHDCMMKGEDEIWVCYYEAAKRQLNVDKLWSIIEQQVIKKLNVHLEDSWLKYLNQLVKVDETTAFLLYKDVQRNQDDSQDECLQLGCYEYM